jgi:hypothetical protein
MADFTYESESINIYESIYESIDDILNKTFPNSTFKGDTSSYEKGSNNSIKKYMVTSNDKTSTKNIVVRQSEQSMESQFLSYIPEQAIRDFINEQDFINEENDTKKRKRIDGDIDFQYIKQYVEQIILAMETYPDINKDHSNWKNASDNKISPKLFFYGFLIKKNPSSLYSVHTVIISEAYDMSLFDFYKKNEKQGEPEHIGYQNRKKNTELQETDINIANQLIKLLTKLHNKSQLICFDIKPANFVINIINETEFDVKMIDLDMDWCHDYSPLLKQRGDIKELIKDLSVMILANHFYYYLKWNIFQKYINGNEENLKVKRDALYELFCEVDSVTGIATKLSRDYQSINKHYLYYENLERTQSNGYPLLPPKECGTLFNAMFTDMHNLKPPEPRISPRTVPGFPIAGGKSKKKKRISKKNKKKRRKTKRKRT